MEASFNVPTRLTKATKKLIRDNGLYFKGDPYSFNGKTYFNIEGMGEHYNKFAVDLRDLLQQNIKISKTRLSTWLEYVIG